MKRINMLPIFRYRFLESLKSIGIFFGIMVFISAAFSLAAANLFGEGSSGSFSSYTFAAGIMVFVLGITTVREDLRLCIQHGVSRRTSFISGIVSALCIGLILAVAGQILLAVSQKATAHIENYFIIDLYQIVYLGGSTAALSLPQHIVSVFLGLSFYICANTTGMLISLIFYRLSKVWTIIVAVGVPVFFTLGLPVIIVNTRLGDILIEPVTNFFNWLADSPFSAVIFFLICAVILRVFCFLLLRRAPIKPAAG